MGSVLAAVVAAFAAAIYENVALDEVAAPEALVQIHVGPRPVPNKVLDK
jgi:hypothetical protein